MTRNFVKAITSIATTFLALALSNHAAAAAAQPAVAAATADGGAGTFTLTDYIGQDWHNDLVTYPLAKAPTAVQQGHLALVGPGGEAVPYQISTVGGASKISFLADLPKYGTVTYKLARHEPAVAPAFQIEREAGSIRVSNGVTGVEVPTAAGHFQDGPILGIRMKSGEWIGGSRLTTKRAITSYQATVTATGPVFADIDCEYRFSGDKQWGVHLRVVAGEPVVLIDENFDLDDDSVWEFLAGKNFSPNQALEKPGEDVKYSIAPISYTSDNVPFQMFPWVVWWDKRNGSFFGFFHTPEGVTATHDANASRLVMTPAAPAAGDKNDDMLIAAAGDVAAWARSGPTVWDNGYTKFITMKATKDGLFNFQMQLAGPGRHWLLGTGSVRDSLVADSEVAPAQKLLNRYMETPLDSVKDMTLTWKHDTVYPRLVLKAETIKAMVADPGFEKQLELNPHGLSVKQILLPMIAGQKGDQAKIDAIKQQVFTELDSMVGYFRYGNNNRGSEMFGTIVPRLDVGLVVPPVDLGLGAGIFTPREQERIFAQLAFVATKISSPDYESPGRSMTGNPNMVTAWCAARVLLACLMPDHPDAHVWYDEAMGRIDGMLTDWEGADGSWLEAPHYQMVAMDAIYLAKLAAYNSGYTKGKLDERLFRAILYLAKLSTPPDPRFGNRRTYPPLGNTYLMETSVVFGAAANLYRQSDPKDAAALQWLWHQQGSPHWVGVGGDFDLDFYTELLADEKWDPPAPAWGSEWFPGFGAVLHSGWPGPRETYMVYHQGDKATAHYDDDQGSFEMWGKGQPLSLDFGYVGYDAAWHHNRMDIGSAGKIQAFAGAPGADYLHGQENGGWDRQIEFMKDADPLGPTYFVMRDSTTGTGNANWWLWMNTNKDPAVKPIAIDGDMLHAVGEGDTDLDVWVAPEAGQTLAKAEIKEVTQKTEKGHLRGDWDTGETTQKGLHLVQPRGTALLTVLYPRLHSQASPKITSLAGGKAIKVSSDQGVDYVFLSLAPFDFKDGAVSFSGTAGAIQVRGAQVTLTLGATGNIGYGADSLQGEPRGQTFDHK